MPFRWFTFFAIVSALFCIGLTILWTRSARTCDVIIAPSRPGERVTITSEFGVLVFELEFPRPATIQPGWVYFDNPLPRRWPGHWQWFGFDVYRGQARHYLVLPPTPLRGITIPHWFAVLVTALLPAMWVRSLRRRQVARWRMRQGLCASCGYDLRESHGRCPECGLAYALGAAAL
jgi:hypothetical protein